MEALLFIIFIAYMVMRALVSVQQKQSNHEKRPPVIENPFPGIPRDLFPDFPEWPETRQGNAPAPAIDATTEVEIPVEKAVLPEKPVAVSGTEVPLIPLEDRSGPVFTFNRGELHKGFVYTTLLAPPRARNPYRFWSRLSKF
jgi:hypothetical protein